MTNNNLNNNNHPYRPLKIGAIFTVVTGVSAYTFFLPFIFLSLALLLSRLCQSIIGNEPNSNVVNMTILLLSAIFVIWFIAVILYIIQRVKKQGKSLSVGAICLIMFVFEFVVHSLLFYIYWATKWKYDNDSWVIFGLIETVPFSSLFFVLLGLILSIIQKKLQKNIERNH